MSAPRRSIVAQPLDAFTYLPAPVGWDPSSPLETMGETMAPQLDNFRPRNGYIEVRNGMRCLAGNYTPWPAINIRGHIVNTANSILNTTPFWSRVTPAATMLTADECTWVRPQIPNWIGITDGLIYKGLTQEGNALNSYPPNGSANIMPGRSQTTLHDIVWYITSARSATLAVDHYAPYTSVAAIPSRQGTTNWQGANMADHSTDAGCPYVCTAIKSYQSRLWVLGGETNANGVNAGVVYSANNLFFTQPIAPVASGTPTPIWSDPTSAVNNYITVDGSDGDTGSGLAVFNNRLIIFKQNSIYVMTGSTPSTYTVTLLSKEHGCIDQRSIVETDHGVYFMGKHGWQLTTGTTVIDVSGALKQVLMASIRRYQSQLLSTNLTQPKGTGDVMSALLDDGSIMVTIRFCPQFDPRASGLVYTDFSGVYHPDTQSWSRVTTFLHAVGDTMPSSHAAADNLITNPHFMGYLINEPGQRQTLSVGNRRSVIVEAFPSFSLYTQAGGGVGTSNDTYNTTALRDNDGLVNSPFFVTYNIPATWLSRFLPLTSAGRFYSSILRWWVDYTHIHPQQDAATLTGTTTGFTASLFDPSWNTLSSAALPFIVSPNSGSNGIWLPPSWNSASEQGLDAQFITGLQMTYPTAQRVTIDQQSETPHALIQIYYNPTLTSPTAQLSLGFYRIHGIGAEFQQGRNLRTSP